MSWPDANARSISRRGEPREIAVNFRPFQQFAALAHGQEFVDRDER
jgi:hypothetical protein